MEATRASELRARIAESDADTAAIRRTPIVSTMLAPAASTAAVCCAAETPGANVTMYGWAGPDVGTELGFGSGLASGGVESDGEGTSVGASDWSGDGTADGSIEGTAVASGGGASGVGAAVG